mmetsp:Transcript_266/g.683  ORF Transcript_266/g.683 Transcript_266/m.683 type:complete len:80 (-) Transcript_266:81-320(-)
MYVRRHRRQLYQDLKALQEDLKALQEDLKALQVLFALKIDLGDRPAPATVAFHLPPLRYCAPPHSFRTSSFGLPARARP